MSRDAWGADWGHYFRTKGAPTRPTTPSIYLLSKIDESRSADKVQTIVKVGQTKRHPLYRRSGKYRGLCYWPVESRMLREIETAVLERFREEFGDPVQGREHFVVDSELRAIKLAQETIGNVEPFSL